MSNLDSYPVPEAGVVGRVLGTQQSDQVEAVIVVPARGKIDILNDVGARIWSLVDGLLSVREIASTISMEYQVEQSQAESDTLGFLEDLARKGAIGFIPAPQKIE
jgi:hypothetical protein